MQVLRGLLTLLLASCVFAAADKTSQEAQAVKAQKLKAKNLPKPPPRQVLATNGQLKDKTYKKLQDHMRLNRREKKEVAQAELATYKDLLLMGFDEVSNSENAVMLRNYRLRNKKRRGFLRKKEASLAAVLFPGVSPEHYVDGEPLWIYADLVESKKTQVPFDYYDLPGCPERVETPLKQARRMRKYAGSPLERRMRKYLGPRLQGHYLKPAPFDIVVKKDKKCTPLCRVSVGGQNLRWLRTLIERQYRVQLQLDSLPVLMRSKELNDVVRGYPLGFKAPSFNLESRASNEPRDVFVYNHLKFAITYHEDPKQFQGIRITGFDVHPVSIKHDAPAGAVGPTSELSTCRGFNVENDPTMYLKIAVGETSNVDIVYSYDVIWIPNTLEWSDRWDVYLLFGAPDDDIHYFSIVNSLMIVLFMTGAIATIMIRTLRKDISGYNELQTIEDAQEETGWKLLHGDVFRPPSVSPMLLSVLVGTGAQIGCTFFFAVLLAILKVTNSLYEGQVLTSILMLYVLNGYVAGYVSARIYKLSEATNWKMNSLMTATALPGVFVLMFSCINVFLGFAGAATAVSFLTIFVLFMVWVCISVPLVFAGASIGLKASVSEVPTKANQIARNIPGSAWHLHRFLIMFVGGILPFASVCIELSYIMWAMWLYQLYFITVLSLAVLVILAATCAQVSIVLCYLQLCAEDHRWWWRAFWNCAMSGVYLFLYSLWFFWSRLDLVGFLPVVVYLTYMSMIAITFGVFCGSIGFLSSLWFTRTIYCECYLTKGF